MLITEQVIRWAPGTPWIALLYWDASPQERRWKQHEKARLLGIRFYSTPDADGNQDSRDLFSMSPRKWLRLTSPRNFPHDLVFVNLSTATTGKLYPA